MKKIESVLEKVIVEIYQSKTLDEGKTKMKELLESTNIKETDKQKMINELDKIQSLVKLQFYATNALFKYEGLGVGDRKSKEKNEKPDTRSEI